MHDDAAEAEAERVAQLERERAVLEATDTKARELAEAKYLNVLQVYCIAVYCCAVATGGDRYRRRPNVPSSLLPNLNILLLQNVPPSSHPVTSFAIYGTIYPLLVASSAT